MYGGLREDRQASQYCAHIQVSSPRCRYVPFPLLCTILLISGHTTLNIILILFFTVLHPYVRIAYFKNTDLWDSDIAVRARTLLEELYDEYAEHLGTHSASDAAVPQSADTDQSGAFACAIAAGRNSSRVSSGDEPQSETDRYVNNAYPCTKVYGVLEWWRVRTVNCTLLLINSKLTERPLLGPRQGVPGALSYRERRSCHTQGQHRDRAAFFLLPPYTYGCTLLDAG